MGELAVKGCVDARAVWLAHALDGHRDHAAYEAYVSAWSCLGEERRRPALALTRDSPPPWLVT